jgi:peptidyl-prolyl cis-trans isomerase D
MSIIQQIREKYAAVGFGAIALSLIAFILMDANKQGSGSQVSASDAIGEINGTKISFGEFTEKSKQMEQMYEMNNRVVDENTRQQIYSQTWNTMVENELFRQELEKLGLKVTDKEFNDILFGKNPPDFLKQEFTDKTTGEFNAAAARQAISELKKAKNNPNKDVVENFYMLPLLENSLKKKYNALLQNSMYVPKWMAEKSIADNNAIASFSYVSVPYSTIVDSTIKVTDEMVKAYIQEHKKEFEQKEPTRNISYVTFGFSPSAEDTASALSAVVNLKEDFASAADAGAFVTRNATTLPFYDGYNSKSKIQIAQKDSIIAAGLGKVYGPYLDGNSYVLSRVVDIKTLPDSAKVRHILIGLNDEQGQPKRTDSAAQKLADSLLAVIKTGAADWQMLSLLYSDDAGSKEKGGVYDYFPPGQMVKEFNDFSFEKPKGEKGVVKTQFGYHVIEVLDQKDFNPSYKIAYLSRAIEASQETINDAQSRANIFYGNSQNVKSFDANATKENLTKLVAEDIKATDYQITGLGVNRKVVRDVFEKDPGEVLEPEEFDNQFVVIAITGAAEEGLVSVAKARPQVESIIRNKEKAKIISGKIGTPASLEAVAQSQATTVQRADSVSFASPVIPNLGYELKAGGYAFNKAMVGKVSPVIAGTNGVFVIKSESIAARADAMSNVEDIQKNLVNQQKSSIMYGSTQAMRNAGKIEDKRSKFL